MRFGKSICKLTIHEVKRCFFTLPMANSRYSYVKNYEEVDSILQNVWIVIRVDGKGFNKFAKIHDFDKPNDVKGLNVMNSAATAVMEEFQDVVISYGGSDEYSFVFRRETNVYKRRSSKLLTNVTSLFSSAYVFNWNTSFPKKNLKYPPCFDGSIFLFPSDQNLKDYLNWRQADVHVNNLYNTAFWNFVLKNGLTDQQAEEKLRGTSSADKNELLFSSFNINYNDLPAIFRKGTILLRKSVEMSGTYVKRQLIEPFHEDMKNEKFWSQNPELLGIH